MPSDDSSMESPLYEDMPTMREQTSSLMPPSEVTSTEPQAGCQENDVRHNTQAC
jgi:hypothetical protein